MTIIRYEINSRPAEGGVSRQTTHKKITPIFLVGKCIYNGQNKFYAWSHVKIFLYSSIIMVQFYHELTIHGVIQSWLNRYMYVQKIPDQV